MAKKPHRLMVMTRRDARLRMKLLMEWDYLCILCGREFHDISSVTFEHLIPKSMSTKRVKKRLLSNFAPTHYNCNQLRGTLSLLKAMRMIDRHRKRLGEKNFQEWINCPVPHRVIPPELLKLTARPLQCLELPEWLPGMTLTE